MMNAARMTIIALVLVAGLAIAQFTPGAADGVIETQSGSVKVERLASLTEPWGMAFLPDGRLLITEKPGRLRVFTSGPGGPAQKLSDPISGVPKVEYREQGGLLDVTIDPDFARNALVYLSYAEAAETQPTNARLIPDPRLGPFVKEDDSVLKGGAVARGRLDGNQLRDVIVIWRQEPKTIGMGHFGGRLIFAPDGKLFITSGDRQRFEPAQDLTGNLGKLIRINADGSIPGDNPFVGKQGARPDIWSLGHRNPLGAAINPATKQLWIHEMGPAHGDEINIPEAGKNYGWPVVSNGDNYDGSVVPDHVTRPEFAPPVYYWHPSVAPSGLHFYTGSLFPAWRGDVLLGGLASESLIRLSLEGNKVTGEERIRMVRIRDVTQAPDGAVLLLTDAKDGALLRLTPATSMVSSK